MNILFYAITSLLLISCQSFTPLAPPAEPLSVLQGATDQTSTQINVLAPSDKNLRFVLSMDKSVLQSPEGIKELIPHTPSQLIQLHLKDLTPDLLYTLHIYDGTQLIDERFFKTQNKDLQTARIDIISCTSDQYIDLQKKQWKQIQDQRPDFLFLIGDNVYADISTLGIFKNVSEKDLWQRYTETRNKLDLYKMKYLIPTFATWDDHDYGVNDGDMTFSLKETSKRIFKTFFPMSPESQLSEGPGVATALLLGSQQFLFLDDRYFRTPKKVTPQSHFGTEQEVWVLEKIKQHSGPSWIISGDQFFGGHHPFESFEGSHPKDFVEFLKNIKKTSKTVLFISGDRHLAEISKIDKKYLGYETFEFTSSGLHAKMHPGSAAKHPNPRSHFTKDGESNYMELRLPLNNTHSLSFEVLYWGEDYKVFYQNNHTLKK